MRRLRSRSGFTLMELVIVVLIIGVLAAFGVPQYFKTVETTKADDAAALVTMAGTTNRMYALDHSNHFTAGGISGTYNSGCNTGACSGTNNPETGCDIVRCKYLAQQDWDNKPYTLTMSNGAGAASSFSCGGAASSSRVWTAYICRKTPGPSPGTGVAPYKSWGYGVDINGSVEAVGGAPAPVAP